MEVELAITVTEEDDGTAVLTVRGPTEGVLGAYMLLMQVIDMVDPKREKTPLEDEGLSDSSVG